MGNGIIYGSQQIWFDQIWTEVIEDVCSGSFTFYISWHRPFIFQVESASGFLWTVLKVGHIRIFLIIFYFLIIILIISMQEKCKDY